MEIIFVLLSISLFMSFVGLLAFLWANANEQFRDLRRPAEEIIMQDETVQSSTFKGEI